MWLKEMIASDLLMCCTDGLKNVFFLKFFILVALLAERESPVPADTYLKKKQFSKNVKKVTRKKTLRSLNKNTNKVIYTGVGA